jgi:CubicO group peptidase (beta-lactamase class C family)
MAHTTLTVAFDERKVDQLLAPLNQCQLPGAAVGIAIRGQPVYRKGFGLSNMEHPLVLSPTTRLRIASISKHMTALAYLLLCEEGRAGIDDPVAKYLPELHPVTHKVTSRQLMAHVSGLHDAHDICHQFSGTGQPVTSEELLSIYRELDEINAAPGSAWIYNNGGFLLLSFMIERITGQTLEEVLRTRIFEPACMYDTLLRRWDSDFVPRSAAAHRLHPAGGYEKSNFFGNAWAGEGGVVSTVDDLLRWLTHMEKSTVGSATTWDAIKTPLTLNHGTTTGYGLGLHIDQYRGAEIIYHPGGGLGFSAQMLKVPAVGLDVVVLVNREDVHAMVLADRILDVSLQGLEPVRNKSTGPFSSGVFRSPTSGRVVQLLVQDGRQVASIDGMDMPVEPEAEGTLRPVEFFRDVKQAITLIGDRLQPSAIRLSGVANPDELVRQEPPQSPSITAVSGRYRASSAGIEVHISRGSEGPQLATTGRWGSAHYSLECLADGIWRARSARLWYHGGILSFDQQATKFGFYSALSRMWGLKFHRVSALDG